MAKKYICGRYSQEIFADRESVLVEEVQRHVKSEHGLEIKANKVRKGIEDT